MTLLDRELSAASLRWELPVVCLLAWAAFAAIPVLEGGIGLSWDALNHHIYLGWTAERPRFDRDFLAASFQAYQFPYLYWPVYKLALAGWSGAWAGVVLATLHVSVVPPVWMLARTCMAGNSVFDLIMRALAVGMAFLTGVVISLFDSTSNDLMAAMPLVWGIAMALAPLNQSRARWQTERRLIVLSGLLSGAAVAFKLSNGPLALLMPVLWWSSGGDGWRARMVKVIMGGISAVLGFAVIYGYWGWQLWTHFGNPIYPFYDSLFMPLRTFVGWVP